jgi:hypothetical protein
MDLTRDEWGKVILLVAGAVLTVLGHIFVREWYQPDVRYATGGAYIHPTLAIANVWLKNWGGADAENITLTASFANPFTNVSTDQTATPFELSAGGTDKKSITGTIKRLAPGELVNIYFITEPSERWVDQKPVVRSIKFDGGLGKPGAPILRTWVLPFLVVSIGWAAIMALTHYWAERQQSTINAQYVEAIQRGHSAAQEGASEEQLLARIEEWHKRLSRWLRPRKDLLISCAQAAFAAVRQSPTPTGAEAGTQGRGQPGVP